nr:mechanosensitive ion channel [Saprospiraceae bacterium]
MDEYFDSETIIVTATEFATTVLLALITLIIGFWLANKVGNLVARGMNKKEIDPTLTPVLSKIIKVTLKVLVLISVAGVFGIQTASFIAVIGAVAFAIGLALQGTLGHFASGILLLTLRPFKVGDLVTMQGIGGTIKEIGIFQTMIHTFDGQKVYLPNGVVTSGAITNIAVLGTLRLEWIFGIGYNDDIDKARSVIKGLLENNPRVLKDQNIDIFVDELADSSVNFKVRCWTLAEDRWGVHYELIEQVKKAFDEHGISFPYPQMDIHHDKLEQ